MKKAAKKRVYKKKSDFWGSKKTVEKVSPPTEFFDDSDEKIKALVAMALILKDKGIKNSDIIDIVIVAKNI